MPSRVLSASLVALLAAPALRAQTVAGGGPTTSADGPGTTGTQSESGGTCATPINDDCCPGNRLSSGPTTGSGGGPAWPTTGPHSSVDQQGRVHVCLPLAAPLWPERPSMRTALRYVAGLAYSTSVPTATEDWGAEVSPNLCTDPTWEAPTDGAGVGITGMSIRDDLFYQPMIAPAAVGLGAVKAVIPFTQISNDNGKRWFTSPRTAVRMYSEDGATQQAPKAFYEAHHPDGTVARFKLMSNHPSQAPDIRYYYAIEWVRDPFDNQITFGYTGDVVTKITYPNGAEQHWNYAPTWAAHGVEITWTNVAGVTGDLTMGLVFDGVPFQTGSKLLRIIYPKVPTIGEPPAAGALYTLPATGHGVEQYRVFELLYYDQATAGHDLLKEIRCARTTALGDGVLTGWRTLETFEYHPALIGGMWRVKKHTGPYGGSETFSYVLQSGQSYARTMTKVDARGTTHVWDVQDSEGRPATYSITPTDDAVGSPRKYDAWSQGQSGLHEPGTLTWSFTYDPLCTCRKVKTVTSPSGRVTTYTWDATTKRLREREVPSPSNIPGDPASVSYKVEWTADGRWPAKISVPRPGSAGGWFTWTALYSFVDRDLAPGQQQGPSRYGSKPASVQWISDPITVTGGTETLYIQTFWDLQGRVTFVSTADGVPVSFGYVDTGTGLGRLAYVERGTGSAAVKTTFAHDDWGNLLAATAQASSANPIPTTYERTATGIPLRIVTGQTAGEHDERLFYYDDWVNLAVELRRNKTSSGGAPAKYGQTSSARAWLRHEWHADIESFAGAAGVRLLREYVDRRPIDADTTGTVAGAVDARMLEYDYLYLPDNVPYEIVLPSGASHRLTFDGYGTLFKSELIDGTSTVLEARYYISNELELTKVFRGDAGAAPALALETDFERTAAGTVTAIVLPGLAAAPEGYSGATGRARRELLVDATGAVVRDRMLDGATSGSPVLSETALVRDELGRVQRTDADIRNASGSASLGTRSVTYTWSGLTRLARVDYPAGRSILYGYDLLGRLTSRQDNAPNPNRRVWAYEANTDFVGRIENHVHDERLAQTRRYDTVFGQDALGRVTTIRELGLNGTQTALDHAFTYYSFGPTESYTDPNGHVRRYLPDALGRLCEMVRVGAGSALLRNHTTYEDWTGSATTRVLRYDGRERVTVETKDFAGRPFLLQNPGADLADPPTLASPHKPFAWLRVFDAASRVASVFDGDGVRTDFHRDGLGRILVRETPNLAATAVSQNVSREVQNRDRLGRITSTVAFNGPLGAAMAAVDSVAFDVDSLGRVHSEAFWYSGGAAALTTVASQWQSSDPDFRSTLTYPSGRQLAFTPDAIGRLARIDQGFSGQGLSALADYQHAGPRTAWRQSHYGSATGQTSRSFDVYGRLSQILDQVTAGTQTTTIAQFDFEYDAAGNLLKERYAKQGTWTPARIGDRFVYDDFDRLADAWLGLDQAAMDGPESGLDESTSQYLRHLAYGLDDANNRAQVRDKPSGGAAVTTPYTTEPSANRYADVGGIALSHDNRGNLTFDGRFAYVYDFRNRLAEVWQVTQTAQSQSGPQTFSATSFAKACSAVQRKSGGMLAIARDPRKLVSAGALTASADILQGSSSTQSSLETATLVALYAYDGLDRRVIRVVPAETTYFHAYDGWNELEELVSGPTSNVAIKRFLWGERLNELVAYERDPGSGWESYFAHQLGHESVTRLVSTAGSVVESIEYSPYGQPTVWVSGTAQGSASTVGNPYLWKGHRVDAETGLVYMRYRHYDPVTGRFLTVDPLGVWGDSVNLGNGYAYGANAPTTSLDPYGLQGSPKPQTISLPGVGSGSFTFNKPGVPPLAKNGNNRAVLIEKGKRLGSITITTKNGEIVGQCGFLSAGQEKALAVVATVLIVADTVASFSPLGALIKKGLSKLLAKAAIKCGLRKAAKGAVKEAARGGASAARGASTAFGRSVQSLKDTLGSGKGPWGRVSAHAEQATGRAYRGGTSIEEVFKNAETGEQIIRHTITRGGKILHETFRMYSKFGG